MTTRAFTLVEAIVTAAITAFIMITLGLLFTYFYKTNAFTLEQSMAVKHARTSVEDAMRYLRETSYGSDGSYPIESAATSSITFYANVNNDSAIERVTYSLKNGKLFRAVGAPIGSPPTYTGITYSTSTVAASVENSTSTPIFTYFNNNGVELVAPINVSKISSVLTTVIIDVNINRAPVSFTLSASATLRNLKYQL